MRRFHCLCGARVFFDSRKCLRCGRLLGFAPDEMEFLSEVSPGAGNPWAMPGGGLPREFTHCRNRVEHAVCNWLVPAAAGGEWCASCLLNRTIPGLDNPDNLRRWRSVEAAKRRLLYSLLDLDLPFGGPSPAGHPPMRFDFLEDRASNPAVAEQYVLIGHAEGLITLNVAEADDDYRERAREQMNEQYRTLLGHLRHESGHYFFDRLVRHGTHIGRFRALFGDERGDYQAALKRHYDEGPVENWQADYISAYAGVHPLEDWAECWAHYLHMTDTMDTAAANDMLRRGSSADDFDGLIVEWLELTVRLNELNRSMGLPDAYPFVLTDPVLEKLRFIHHEIIEAGPAS